MTVSPKLIPLAATAVVLAGLYASGCLCFANFGSPRVLVNLLADSSFLGIAAVGATLVIISGGIDLSVGAVVAFTSVWVAALVGPWGVDPASAIVSALLLGTTFGAVMGGLIHGFRLPAFLVTLAGMFLARGLAFVLHPQSLGIRHGFFQQTLVQDLAIPLGERLALPVVAVVFPAWLVLAICLAHTTCWGRAIYAIGADEHASRLMGLPVGRTRVGVYAFSGMCSSLAGVVYACYTQSGNPAACTGFELDAIAAVVIGGTLLSGGAGYVAGTAMGVLILGLIQTLITFHGGLSSWWTRIFVGLLVLAFVLLQSLVAALARRLAGAAVAAASGAASGSGRQE
ncbi:MAG: sugar ABC transporter permease YjfF [Phycisphaerae bacterium]|nr:sugar ABC transporter permease YjfF [Phycisphaerae bacterium]